MNKYTFYNRETGVVDYSVECTEELLASIISSQPNSNYIEGEYLKEFYYFENDIPIKIPPFPGDSYIFNYITKQWEVDVKLATNKVLNIRSQLLQESDWTDTVSAQTRLTNWEDWQIYRQALRDITNQPEFPLNIIWPVMPQ